MGMNKLNLKTAFSCLDILSKTENYQLTKKWSRQGMYFLYWSRQQKDKICLIHFELVRDQRLFKKI